MKKISNVTDLPLDISLDQKDQFNIEVYSNALSKFIENIAPPITIALQGEWGSGKTSLMKTLKYRLCAERNEFDAVWINTWQFSLMNDKMTAIQKILLNIPVLLSMNYQPFLVPDNKILIAFPILKIQCKLFVARSSLFFLLKNYLSFLLENFQ